MLQGFSIQPSVPEPAPVPKGIIVPDELISVIENTRDLFGEYDGAFDKEAQKHCDELIALVKQRDGFGRAKYGQPLMSKDGRNGIEDARQELGDLMQYVMKCKLGGEDLKEFMRLLAVASMIMRQIAK